jgi:regulator of sigma E protease
VATHHANFLWYESHHAQLLPPSSGVPGIGILPASTFVRAVDPGSPAALAGIRPGDRILSAAGAPLTQWVILNDIFGRNRDTPVAFGVQSPGEAPRALEIQLGTRTWKDIYQHEQTEYWFGAHPFDKAFISERESVRGRATYALSSAVDETGAAIAIIWSALLQMLTFETGVEGLSSVLGLYSVAGTAYDQGPSNFLLLVAFLSINLGIINLLPIPVLDGGHLLFFTIEAVRRRPLSQRAREISSAIGLVIILLLLLVATRNDIIRYWL